MSTKYTKNAKKTNVKTADIFRLFYALCFFVDSRCFLYAGFRLEIKEWVSVDMNMAAVQ